jgi:hypothetical protein
VTVLGWIVLVVLLLFAVGASPTWGWNAGYGLGWWPTGGLGLVLLVFLALLLARRL